ncbi:hypothetical protein [Streptomyces goshikiensis]|uniref:hypothetical protein n=1 Tax=Streptomyces goshikiensis TaxID=1942 RepID=UPI0037B4BA5B
MRLGPLSASHPPPLKRQADEPKKRITARDEQLADLTEFKALAISRLVAQHDEIERLRTQIAVVGNVRALPAAGLGTSPHP